MWHALTLSGVSDHYILAYPTTEAEVRIKNSWIAAVSAGLASLLLVGAGTASAASMPVNGRDTSVTVTGADELGALGIILSSNAPVDGVGRLVFNITGGVFDLFFLEGTLEHQANLGLTLSSGVDTIDFTNLVIDTTGFDFLVYATASVTLAPFEPVVVPGVPLFTMTFCNAPAVFGPCVNNDGSFQIDGYGLLMTPDAAGLIGDAFSLDTSSLIDSQFGIANIAITFVPEPGTLVLAGFGLAGLGAARRNRTA